MIEKEFVELRDRMCNIINVSNDVFLLKRNYPIPYARAIVADALYNMGYRWKQIGDVMGKSHSTLLIMCCKLHQIKELKPFRQVKKIYEEFYEQ